MKVLTREREEATVMPREAGLAGEPNANVSGTQEKQEEEEGEGGRERKGEEQAVALWIKIPYRSSLASRPLQVMVF